MIEKFIQNIQKIDGVTGIKHWYSADDIYYVNGFEINDIIGYTEEDTAQMEINLIEGTIDYKQLAAQNGVVMLQDKADGGYC